MAALRAGQIDAISNLDPVTRGAAEWQRHSDISTRAMSRRPKRYRRPDAAATLYARCHFIERIRNTVQALTKAIVRAKSGSSRTGIGHRQVGAGKIPAWRSSGVHRRVRKAKPALSGDGMFPEQGAATALRACKAVDDNMKTAKIDLKAVLQTTLYARRTRSIRRDSDR